ncbi:MAG: HI0074 family nucleotidyltransferase substrate-binding subunit [Saprospiraceae bacterium]
MTTTQIIKKVKSIILGCCDPDRIWVYGSRIREDWYSGSDLDIAYMCENISMEAKSNILKAVSNLDTLMKIDIKNISKTDSRMTNRVKSSGKVIYSASKKLKVEDSLYNLNRTLLKLEEVLAGKEKYKEDGYSDAFTDISIKRFEFNWELAWKAIKRYLDYEGSPCYSPRECIKKAFEFHLITNEPLWLEMLEMRNLSSHIYDEWQMKEMVERIPDFAKEDCKF